MVEQFLQFKPDQVPDAILKFWRETAEANDRINILTRSPEWFRMMAEGRSGSSVCVCRDNAGRNEAVLPLIPVKAPWGGEMMKVVGGELIARLDTRAGSIAEPIKALLGNSPVLHFDHLPESQLTLLRAVAGKAGCKVFTLWSGMPHYRLVIPDGADSMRNLHSRRTRQKVNASFRKLAAELPGLEVAEYRSCSRMASIRKELELMMNSTWQAEKLGHGFSLDSMRPVDRNGWLRCFCLKNPDKVAAFAGCYQGMGTLVYELVGYDQAYKGFSPGKILLNRMMEMLYESDTPAYVDFGEGEGLYKSGFANDAISINTAFLAAAGSPASFRISMFCVRGKVLKFLGRLITRCR